MTYSVAIVMPVVGTFFLAFGFLEDSGYLPRLAVMLNRFFRFWASTGRRCCPWSWGWAAAPWPP